MRLFELEQIQEVREYLNTNEYGAWIDTKANKVISIPNWSVHHDYLLSRWDLPVNTEEDLYDRAYNNGLVRIVHEIEGYLGVEGNLKEIKKAWKFIRPTAMKSVQVDIDTPQDRDGSYQFILPKERTKLIQFIEKL